MSKIQLDEATRSAYELFVDPYLTNDSYTSYAISTVLNKILVERQIKEVRSQMMYNYARNGMIVPGEKIFGSSLREFTKIEVRDFLVRYLARTLVGITSVNIQATESVDQDLEVQDQDLEAQDL